MATAASLPDGTSSAVRAVRRLMTSPSCSPADDSPAAAAVADTVIGVSSDTMPLDTASRATTPVMTLVMEAICVGEDALRSKYTVPAESITMAYSASMLGLCATDKPRASTVWP